MRALSILLSLILWLTPAFQAFANTMASAHCRAQGHISAAAPDAAHDSLHAQHHGEAQAESAGTTHADHGVSQPAGDAGHCECGCLCNLACAASTALAPSLMTADALVPEHFRAVSSGVHPHSTHTVLHRPPIFS